METELPDHYATLGLDRKCTTEQVRSAYRLLSKRCHPDVNPGPEAAAQFRQISVAHEILSDPAKRKEYDRELAKAEKVPEREGKIEKNIAQDVNLRIEDLIRGTTLRVQVNDPANPEGPETYELHVPPETAPGARIRIPRDAPFKGGFVQLRVRVLPGFRFKARGADLKCDLRISTRRAMEGGTEMLTGAGGNPIRLTIPPRVGRGEVLRVPGEGLPKPRGGRGDLLVKITYRPEVRVTRSTGRAPW